MSHSSRPTLTFQEFKELLSRELAIDQNRLVPEASFIEDLLVDSIRMVEMMLRLEEQGFSIPLETAWQIETVADAYQCYAESLAASE